MDASQISFDEPVELRWQSVINEGEKQNTLHKLVPVLLARYPNNQQLQAACAPWEAAEPVTAQVVEPPTPEPPTPEHDAPLVIVTETPTTTTTTTQRKKGAAAVDLVPLVVPAELADAAYETIVATVASLRMTITAMDKRLNELEARQARFVAAFETPLSEDEKS